MKKFCRVLDPYADLMKKKQRTAYIEHDHYNDKILIFTSVQT